MPGSLGHGAGLNSSIDLAVSDEAVASNQKLSHVPQRSALAFRFTVASCVAQVMLLPVMGAVHAAFESGSPLWYGTSLKPGFEIVVPAGKSTVKPAPQRGELTVCTAHARC